MLNTPQIYRRQHFDNVLNNNIIPEGNTGVKQIAVIKETTERMLSDKHRVLEHLRTVPLSIKKTKTSNM